MGFGSLQHLQDAKIRFPRALAHPPRSALRVWLPPRRLTPFGALPVLFQPGGALGIPPSELSPPARSPAVSGRRHPLTVSPSGHSRRVSGWPAHWAAVPGLWPSRESLAADACLARRPPDAPLGFALPGYPGNGLVWDFAQTPLARFALEKSKQLECRRHRVSISHHLASSATCTRQAWTRQPS